MSITVPMYGFGGGGGAALNFKVVGGLTQPANPSENTIWVETDVPIASWYFQAEKPENMAEGDVWFLVGTSGEKKFNALKKDGIIVYPFSASQYISSEWVNKTAKIYQVGKWVDIDRLYLYYKGDEYVDITGGWVATACYQTTNQNGYYIGKAEKPIITIDGDYMKIVSNGGAGLVHTANKIDLTSINTIVVDGSILSKYETLTGIYIRDNLNSPYGKEYVACYTPNKVNVEETGEFSVDVSSLIGPFYICLAVSQMSDGPSKIRMRIMYLEV